MFKCQLHGSQLGAMLELLPLQCDDLTTHGGLFFALLLLQNLQRLREQTQKYQLEPSLQARNREDSS